MVQSRLRTSLNLLGIVLSISATHAFVPNSVINTRSDIKHSNALNSPNAWGVSVNNFEEQLTHPSCSFHLQASESNEDGSSCPKIIISGAPASGKGTQCEIIKKDFGVVHLSTGDMLRAAVAAKTPVGVSAKEYMDAGKLVPDDVIIGVVKDRLEESDCQSQGWLLDGFPRTRAQADALAAAGISADCFLFLNVPDEILVERVVGRRTDPETGKIYHMKFSPPEDEVVKARLEQRSDDTEEKVKVRLEQFHDNVAAVKGCYTDISFEIDGTCKPDEVAGFIAEALKEKC